MDERGVGPTCILCGRVGCLGHTSNHTVPVGHELTESAGASIGPNFGYPRVYERTNGMYISPERLYLDKDGKVVKADDPNRVSLLVGKGGSIPQADADRYGLTGTADEPDEKAAAPKATKAVTKAPENKAKG